MAGAISSGPVVGVEAHTGFRPLVGCYVRRRMMATAPNTIPSAISIEALSVGERKRGTHRDRDIVAGCEESSC